MGASALGNISDQWRDTIGFGTVELNKLRIGNSGAIVGGKPEFASVYMNDFFIVHTLDDNGGGADTALFGIAAAGDSPVPVPADSVNGEISIPTSAATDNHENYVSSFSENWKFAADKKLWFEARVKLTEANTDDANIIVGLSDTVGANFLLDNGAGPAASYDGAVFYKVDGGTVWNFENSNATTQNASTSTATFTSATYHTLGFFFDPADNTTGRIYPYVDGTRLDAESITLSGLEEMHWVLGVKNGGAAIETLICDYVFVSQER